MKILGSGRYAVNAKLQLALDIITILCSLTFMYIAFLRFSSTDFFPKLTYLTPQELFEQGGPGLPATIGLHINGFHEFDIVKGSFDVDLTIWFRFNPQQITIEQIENFSFENAEVKSKIKTMTKIEGSDIVVYYDMRVLFYIPLSYKTFPVDDHRIFLVVDNNFFTASQILLTSSYRDVTTNPEIYVAGWNLRDQGVLSGFIGKFSSDEEHALYHPRIIFYFDFERSGFRHSVMILLPLLLIFFTTLFSFSFELDSNVDSFAVKPFNLISVTTAGLMALVGYRFVIERFSPVVGYFTISDYIFLFFLLAISFVLGINMLGTRISGVQKTIITILLHVISNVIFYMLFLVF